MKLRYLSIISALVFVFTVSHKRAESFEDVIEPLPVIAIIEFVNEGIASEIIDRIDSELSLVFDAIPEYRTIHKTEINKILSQNDLSLNADCTTDECLADLGDKLNAEFVLHGCVGLTEGAYIFSSRLINVRTSMIASEASEVAYFPGDFKKTAEMLTMKLFEFYEDIKEYEKSTESKVDISTATISVFETTHNEVTNSGSEEFRKTIEDVLREMMENKRVAKYLPAEEIPRDSRDRIMRCRDHHCRIKASEDIEADYIVFAQHERVCDVNFINMELINRIEAKVGKRVVETFNGEGSQLVEAARYATRELFSEYHDGKGTLIVNSTEKGANLFINGQKSEMGMANSFNGGKYKVRAIAEGLIPWISDVYLFAGKEKELDVTLKPISPIADRNTCCVRIEKKWYEKWWVWTAVGVVVGGSLAVGLYYGLE